LSLQTKRWRGALLVADGLGRWDVCSLGEGLGEVENDVLVDGHEEHLAVELEDVAAFGSLEGSDLLRAHPTSGDKRRQEEEEDVRVSFFWDAVQGGDRGTEGRGGRRTRLSKVCSTSGSLKKSPNVTMNVPSA